MANVVVESSLDPVIGLVSERFLTGGSLLLKGRIADGLAHAVLGMVAYSLFGLPAMLLVSADSFAQSQTGEGLVQLVRNPGTTETITPTPKKS